MNFIFNIIIFKLLNLTPTNGVNSYSETPEFNANQIELNRFDRKLRRASFEILRI